MNYENLTPVVGVITNISTQEGDCCTQFTTRGGGGQPVNMCLSVDTFVVDTMRMMPGMLVAACYDNTLPVPRIYPPQYQADLIDVVRPEEDVNLSWFDETLTASDQSLKLNLYQSTVLSTLNGQPYFCFPANHFLLVYYAAATKSIPPQTAPNRVIVLCSQTCKELFFFIFTRPL